MRMTKATDDHMYGYQDEVVLHKDKKSKTMKIMRKIMRMRRSWTSVVVPPLVGSFARL